MWMAINHGYHVMVNIFKQYLKKGHLIVLKLKWDQNGTNF